MPGSPSVLLVTVVKPCLKYSAKERTSTLKYNYTPTTPVSVSLNSTFTEWMPKSMSGYLRVLEITSYFSKKGWPGCDGPGGRGTAWTLNEIFWLFLITAFILMAELSKSPTRGSYTIMLSPCLILTRGIYSGPYSCGGKFIMIDKFLSKSAYATFWKLLLLKSVNCLFILSTAVCHDSPAL